MHLSSFNRMSPLYYFPAVPVHHDRVLRDWTAVSSCRPHIFVFFNCQVSIHGVAVLDGERTEQTSARMCGSVISTRLSAANFRGRPPELLFKA